MSSFQTFKLTCMYVSVTICMLCHKITAYDAYDDDSNLNNSVHYSDLAMYEGLDGGSWYSLITKNLAIYSLSLKFWLIH